MAIQFWESKRYRSPSTVSSIDVSFFDIQPHDALVSLSWKLLFFMVSLLSLNNLPNSMNLFKDITKN